MIIEMAGPPGAGKSTVAKLLKAALEEKGLTAYWAEQAEAEYISRSKVLAPLTKAWNALRGTFQNPGLVWPTLRAQFSRQLPLRYRAWIFKVFLWTLARHRLLKVKLPPEEIAIFDAGLLHLSVSLFTSEKLPATAEGIIRYVRRLPQPDLLVYVNAPLDLCLQRLENRTLPLRLQALEGEAVAPFVAHQAEALSTAIGEAQRLGWEIQQIENSGHLVSLEEGLQAFAQEFASQN